MLLVPKIFVLSSEQILSEIMENGIHIYTGQIDEEEDSDEIKELRVKDYNKWEGL